MRIGILLIASHALLRADAATCPPGVTAPAAPTLMVSTANPVTEAWLVATNCSSTAVSLEAMTLFLDGLDVHRITSVPSDTRTVAAARAGNLKAADFSSAKRLSYIALWQFPSTFADNLALPATLDTLVLGNSTFKSVDKIKLPESLTVLKLIDSEVSSITTLPTGLRTLELTKNTFTSLAFPMPSSVESLSLDGNAITRLERLTFPDTLTTFSCAYCEIKTIRGVQWSSLLSELDLTGNPTQMIELRQSDYDVWRKFSRFQIPIIPTPKCTDPQATAVLLAPSLNICVISDDRFKVLYGSGEESQSGSSSSSDSSSDSSSAKSGSSGSGGSMATGTSSSTARDGVPSPTDVGGSNPTAGQGSDGDVNQNPTTTSSNSIVVVVLVLVSSLFAIILAVVAYRRWSKSKYEKFNAGVNTNSSMLSSTPAMTGWHHEPSNAGSSQEYLTNDIRNDKTLIPFRIDQASIQLTKQIARGGFGVIYQASYQGDTVAVKQMLPDAWRNETMLSSFMDEIRMCATLTHPKIVEFIGVAWSSLRDISVVIEFMEGGDLYAVMHRHKQSQSQLGQRSQTAMTRATSVSSSPRDWFEPWTTHHINSKTSIAKDAAEAVVYLHSFSSPILHRDLKARNVLLDAQGHAKLSDFGISRELSVDETMTSEVGTSAWIAPEVLRGDRYSEQADMYSFGVLLVELDRCGHPYTGDEQELRLVDGSLYRMSAQAPALPASRASGSLALRETHSQMAHKNMQIAMLVSTGQLRPRPSRGCPASVQLLMERCLSFAPEDRPTAMEMHYELRQLIRKE